MSIGSNIKAIRESHGLTQEELGKIAGVTDKAVSTWENEIKTPRMGAIQKIADYFGVPKSKIIDDEISINNLVPHPKMPPYRLDLFGGTDESENMNDVIVEIYKRLPEKKRKEVLLTLLDMLKK